MKQDNNIYSSGKGKLIVRKSDGFIMGDTSDLGSDDSIDNYEERKFTQKEINAFYESVGIKQTK